MTETVDAQGTVVGIGLLVAVGVLAYGAVVSDSILGVDSMTAAMWVFALTLGVISLLHAFFGEYNLAWGHGGAAFGWVFVLAGSSGFQVAIGLVLLVLSACYIAILTIRLRSD